MPSRDRRQNKELEPELEPELNSFDQIVQNLGGYTRHLVVKTNPKITV